MRSAPRSRSDRWRRGLDAWRQWRHTRPFWGALFVAVGGTEILFTEAVPIPLAFHIGLQGVAGYLIPVVLLLTGLLLLFHPVQRTFYSLLAIILALGCWITSNLGGFFLGMLAGVIGGSLALAWQQRQPPDQEPDAKAPQKRPSVGLALLKPEHPTQAGSAAPQSSDVSPADPQPHRPPDAGLAQ